MKLTSEMLFSATHRICGGARRSSRTRSIARKVEEKNQGGDIDATHAYEIGTRDTVGRR